MHPRIAELLAYTDRQGEVLHAAYYGVPPEQRGLRPDPERWSAAEVVHHVTLVERRIVDLLRRLIGDAATLPRETETSPVVPTLDIARIVDRASRVAASRAVWPQNTDPARVWDDFAAAHRELMSVIETADGLAMGAVSAPHPVFKDFSGYEWIAFAGAHAARHAAQIREIAAGSEGRESPKRVV